SDFGFARQQESTSVTGHAGIVPYIDPMCFLDVNYKRKQPADVYSLGVVLWEITRYEAMIFPRHLMCEANPIHFSAVAIHHFKTFPFPTPCLALRLPLKIFARSPLRIRQMLM